jgi:peptidoglycan-associated lipoprotein
LKANSAFLKKFPNIKIQIEGHCDERGTNEYNLALGERRANSTKKYLLSLGVSENRMSTISYGEEKPMDSAHNEEAWAKNRRAHFVITAK